MILLDTNVVSAAMTREPDPRVRGWLDTQSAETLFLSSITVAELLFGIGALPAGKRKNALAAALDDVLDVFAARILPFDTSAARRHADLAVRARAAGKGFPRRTATSPRSLPRTGSRWRRGIRAHSRRLG